MLKEQSAKRKPGDVAAVRAEGGIYLFALLLSANNLNIKLPQ
jgi:hypothetical protein